MNTRKNPAWYATGNITPLPNARIDALYDALKLRISDFHDRRLQGYYETTNQLDTLTLAKWYTTHILNRNPKPNAVLRDDLYKQNNGVLLQELGVAMRVKAKAKQRGHGMRAYECSSTVVRIRHI